MALTPFYLLDWPNPPGPAFPIEMRSFIVSSGTKLFVGQDVQFGAAGQWQTYDYPNPTLLGDNNSRRTHTWSYPLSLIGADSLPFFLTDYPNPTLRLPNLELRTHFQNLVTLVLVGSDSLPFALYDWPVPRGYQFLMSLRTWIDALKAALTGVIIYKIRRAEQTTMGSAQRVEKKQ